ncbi:MAG: PIN domain-containing protein [Betaproteobacteria bacterium]|nr:PIN domain-containing protein [Betaproteobacteria bacterium]
MSWLLDTCVISELVRPEPAAQVVAWVDSCEEETLFLSAITLGELEKGIAKLPASARRARLESWIRRDLPERFQGRILPVDETVATRWGAVSGAAEIRGTPLPVIDALIAATGMAHDLTVVTRNTADFARCGARCFDPWSES